MLELCSQQRAYGTAVSAIIITKQTSPTPIRKGMRFHCIGWFLWFKYMQACRRMLYREKNGKAILCWACFLAFDILHGMCI